MKQYLQLLQDIKDKGVKKESGRPNMPGTTSLFGYQFRHDLSKGFPLLTTKKMAWNAIVKELVWFLRGDTNIKYLIDNNCNIWNQDAYNYYIKVRKQFSENGTEKARMFNLVCPKPLSFEEFIEAVKTSKENESHFNINYKYGDCGFQYGRVWRNWEKLTPGQFPSPVPYTLESIDQIRNVITQIKENPYSRRHLVTAIDPAHENDLALFWCHALFQFNCRPLTFEQKIQWVMQNKEIDLENLAITEEASKPETPQYFLDCQLYQRSCDVVLGVPFNIASYALLTHIIAKMCNMVPGDYIHTFGDVHIYDNHMDAVNEQLKRTPGPLPQVEISPNICLGTNIEIFKDDTFVSCIKLLNYNSQDKIKAELSTGMVKSN